MLEKSKGIIIPPDILRRRTYRTIQSFYEGLQKFCTKMNWKYTEPKPSQEELSIDSIYRSNNMVTFEEKTQYYNGAPKEFYISFALPSFTAEPSDRTPIFEEIRLPQIGFYHTFSDDLVARTLLVQNLSKSQRN